MVRFVAFKPTEPVRLVPVQQKVSELLPSKRKEGQSSGLYSAFLILLYMFHMYECSDAYVYKYMYVHTVYTYIYTHILYVYMISTNML